MMDCIWQRNCGLFRYWNRWSSVLSGRPQEQQHTGSPQCCFTSVGDGIREKFNNKGRQYFELLFGCQLVGSTSGDFEYNLNCYFDCYFDFNCDLNCDLNCDYNYNFDLDLD